MGGHILSAIVGHLALGLLPACPLSVRNCRKARTCLDRSSFRGL